MKARVLSYFVFWDRAKNCCCNAPLKIHCLHLRFNGNVTGSGSDCSILGDLSLLIPIPTATSKLHPTAHLFPSISSLKGKSFLSLHTEPHPTSEGTSENTHFTESPRVLFPQCFPQCLQLPESTSGTKMLPHIPQGLKPVEWLLGYACFGDLGCSWSVLSS